MTATHLQLERHMRNGVQRVFFPPQSSHTTLPWAWTMPSLLESCSYHILDLQMLIQDANIDTSEVSKWFIYRVHSSNGIHMQVTRLNA